MTVSSGPGTTAGRRAERRATLSELDGMAIIPTTIVVVNVVEHGDSATRSAESSRLEDNTVLENYVSQSADGHVGTGTPPKVRQLYYAFKACDIIVASCGKVNI